MFIKETHSSGTVDAFRLESVISVNLTGSGSVVNARLSDGSQIGMAYANHTEAEAALDALLQRLGWIDTPEGGA